MKPEAEALIEILGLKHSAELSAQGFPFYTNDDATSRLVISGVGKINAAAATAWLGGISSNENGTAAWINFGICGALESETGIVFRAGRITDEATGKSWYPPAVWKREKNDFGVVEVITVDAPSSDYPPSGKVVEMEAAGFVPAALRFSTSELVQVIKVVSDNRSDGIETVNPKSIRELCHTAATEVVGWTKKVTELAAEFSNLTEHPELVKEVLNRFHFSETRKHQLNRLVRRALVLESETEVKKAIADSKSAKDCLADLERLCSRSLV